MNDLPVDAHVTLWLNPGEWVLNETLIATAAAGLRNPERARRLLAGIVPTLDEFTQRAADMDASAEDCLNAPPVPGDDAGLIAGLNRQRAQVAQMAAQDYRERSARLLDVAARLLGPDHPAADLMAAETRARLLIEIAAR